MLKDLEDLGLSEKEAKVYLAALEIGRATADQLAKQAKIVRPTTYVQIKSLMARGLMSTYEEGKKTYFAPESPETLRRVLEQQKDSIQSKFSELDRLLPGLTQMFATAGERPVVRFFPGKEGLTAVREEVLNTKEKKLLVFLSSSNMPKIYSEKEIDDYTNRRTALGVHSKAIYTHRDYFLQTPKNELSERRFLPKVELTIDIRIFDNKTAIFSLEGNLFAMVIESKQIAESMKSLFNFLWDVGEKPENE